MLKNKYNTQTINTLHLQTTFCSNIIYYNFHFLFCQSHLNALFINMTLNIFMLTSFYAYVMLCLENLGGF